MSDPGCGRGCSSPGTPAGAGVRDVPGVEAVEAAAAGLGPACARRSGTEAAATEIRADRERKARHAESDREEARREADQRRAERFEAPSPHSGDSAGDDYA